MDGSASQPVPDGHSPLAKRTASEGPNNGAEAKRIKASHHKSPDPDAHAKAQAPANKWRVPFPDKVCALDRFLVSNLGSGGRD